MTADNSEDPLARIYLADVEYSVMDLPATISIQNEISRGYLY